MRVAVIPRGTSLTSVAILVPCQKWKREPLWKPSAGPIALCIRP